MKYRFQVGRYVEIPVSIATIKSSLCYFCEYRAAPMLFMLLSVVIPILLTNLVYRLSIDASGMFVIIVIIVKSGILLPCWLCFTGMISRHFFILMASNENGKIISYWMKNTKMYFG